MDIITFLSFGYSQIHPKGILFLFMGILIGYALGRTWRQNFFSKKPLAGVAPLLFSPAWCNSFIAANVTALNHAISITWVIERATLSPLRAQLMCSFEASMSKALIAFLAPLAQSHEALVLFISHTGDIAGVLDLRISCAQLMTRYGEHVLENHYIIGVDLASRTYGFYAREKRYEHISGHHLKALLGQLYIPLQENS